MYSSENRQYYLSRGRCPRCGGKNPVVPGRVLCFECQKKHDDEQKERRKRWRESGLCPRCGGERDDPDRVLCNACREYMTDLRRDGAAHAKERRDMLRDAGLCTRCGIRYAEPFRAWCSRCQKRHTAYTNTPEQRERAKARRAARKAAGLCIDCGRPTRDGKSRCDRCNAMRQESTIKYKILQKINAEADEARRRTRV